MFPKYLLFMETNLRHSPYSQFHLYYYFYSVKKLILSLGLLNSTKALHMFTILIKSFSLILVTLYLPCCTECLVNLFSSKLAYLKYYSITNWKHISLLFLFKTVLSISIFFKYFSFSLLLKYLSFFILPSSN